MVRLFQWRILGGVERSYVDKRCVEWWSYGVDERLRVHERYLGLNLTVRVARMSDRPVLLMHRGHEASGELRHPELAHLVVR